jgi:hypothetical protein
MRSNIKKLVLGLALIAATVMATSCNSINRETSPVKLIVTTDQILQRIDLSGGTSCDQSAATIQMQTVVIQDPNNGVKLPSDNRLNDVVIDRYQVSYVRTDGGTAVPAPFVRSISTIIVPGGSSGFLTRFVIFEPDAVRQAPFAALQPVNGGRDPETGKAFVKLEIVLTIFGQTVAGERVSGTTRIPLDFCFACNGCA